MRAPRGSVPDIREVTAVGVGICGRSVVRVWAKWRKRRRRRRGLRETGGEEGEEVYDCAARFDDIPVKGINFTGNRSINACFMAPSILSLCPLGCGENAIERLLSATQGSRLLFNCSHPTRADSPAGLNQYTNEESFDYIHRLTICYLVDRKVYI